MSGANAHLPSFQFINFYYPMSKLIGPHVIFKQTAPATFTWLHIKRSVVKSYKAPVAHVTDNMIHYLSDKA